MSRLIYADDVKKRGDCYPPEVRNVISNILRHTKTVKDVVTVVRCSECQYWQPPTYQEQEDGSTVGHCTAACKGQTDMNWFCADGTR